MRACALEHVSACGCGRWWWGAFARVLGPGQLGVVQRGSARSPLRGLCFPPLMRGHWAGRRSEQLACDPVRRALAVVVGNALGLHLRRREPGCHGPHSGGTCVGARTCAGPVVSCLGADGPRLPELRMQRVRGRALTDSPRVLALRRDVHVCTCVHVPGFARAQAWVVLEHRSHAPAALLSLSYGGPSPGFDAVVFSGRGLDRMGAIVSTTGEVTLANATAATRCELPLPGAPYRLRTAAV
jgi:hypothetical protein